MMPEPCWAASKFQWASQNSDLECQDEIVYAQIGNFVVPVLPCFEAAGQQAILHPFSHWYLQVVLASSLNLLFVPRIFK